ncbi:MAG TPA: pseudouridine-5'-phosphate glycosidase [Gaiellaceae bacterium]|nr:pseudouridine-5'-phosphate glycosidase [Gaiellaceae bacterium]
MIRVADEVREARAVVALETTIVAHGFPPGEGVEVGLECERRVREAGAVPATVGVLDGEIRVGLTEDELGRFTVDARKLGPRDLAACVARGETGATTVGGTLAVCRHAGIRFMGTGGIGGVHRGPSLDISADLIELSRAPVVVVSSGVKSLLDVKATAELLETLCVPVLGWRTDTMPRFYDAGGGPPVSQRVDTADDVVSIARQHWDLVGCGVLLANPPPRSIDVEALIEAALDDALDFGTTGQGLTPFVLSELHERSGGETLGLNRELAEANAALAAEVAVAAA